MIALLILLYLLQFVIVFIIMKIDTDYDDSDDLYGAMFITSLTGIFYIMLTIFIVAGIVHLISQIPSYIRKKQKEKPNVENLLPNTLSYRSFAFCGIQNNF